MIYDYECSYCGNKQYGVEQSVKDKPIKKCSKCNKLTLERVILSPPMVKCTNITTVGQLAEKNAKKIGKYALSERSEKNKNKIEKNIYGNLDKKQTRKLANMSKKQKEKYVMTGEGL